MIDLRCGDWVEVLRTLPDESVNCVVTSPPYWGLRDYGTAKWEGGSASCDHKAGRFERPGLTSKQSSNAGSSGDEAAHFCAKCGAIRIDAQLGLEKTPEEYVAKIVAGFREVRRVLRKDGTMFLNLGDSYAGSGRGRDADGTWNPGQGGSKQETNVGAITGRCVNAKSLSKNLIKEGAIGNAWVKPPKGLKPKDLCGIPWRVAFALQADGWWLRMDIIWAKPNPMPESVTDRPTKSHEYVFLMSKSAKYYYDFDAIREIGEGYGRGTEFRAPKYLNNNSFNNQAEKPGVSCGHSYEGGRNKRSVWTIATQKFSDYGYDFSTADYVDAHDIPRKWSPDCPVHERDGRLRPERPGAASCDEQEPCPLNDNEHRHCHHASTPSLSALPTDCCKRNRDEGNPSCAQQDDIGANKIDDLPDVAELGIPAHTNDTQEQSSLSTTDCCPPSCESFATEHNIDDRRNGHGDQTLSGDNACEESASRIENTELPLYENEHGGSTHANSTTPCTDHRKLRGQTSSCKNDKYSCIKDTQAKCTCQVNRISHFATFPEKVVEPCILAGCPEGGTVLDPFAGTCTVGLVAARLNRSFVGIDLNAEYLKMRRKQIDAIVRQERMAV